MRKQELERVSVAAKHQQSRADAASSFGLHGSRF
jgi:hypothetical protein